MSTLEEIQKLIAGDGSADDKLQHLAHVFEGYRDAVIALEDCPYAPDSARANSWELGERLAELDKKVGTPNIQEAAAPATQGRNYTVTVQQSMYRSAGVVLFANSPEAAEELVAKRIEAGLLTSADLLWGTPEADGEIETTGDVD